MLKEIYQTYSRAPGTAGAKIRISCSLLLDALRGITSSMRCGPDGQNVWQMDWRTQINGETSLIAEMLGR